MIEVKNGNLHIAGSGLEILNDTCNVIFHVYKDTAVQLGADEAEKGMKELMHIAIERANEEMKKENKERKNEKHDSPNINTFLRKMSIAAILVGGVMHDVD